MVIHETHMAGSGQFDPPATAPAEKAPAPTPEAPKSISETGNGRITEQKWLEKVNRFKAEKGSAQKDTTPPKKEGKVDEKSEKKAEIPLKTEGKVAQTKSEKEVPKVDSSVVSSDKVAVATEKKEGEVEKDTPFVVNPKFTAVQKEYDLPEWAQSVIKDVETEKEVKSVFEKAMGLDHVKARHQELYAQYQELGKNYSEIATKESKLRQIYRDAIQSQNVFRLDDFFKELQISPEVVLQYAAAKLQYEQLPPEQKQMLDGQLVAQRQAREYEEQNQTLSQQAQTAMAQARTMMLDAVLAKPDIAPIVQAFESTSGRKPGDFVQRVREHGEYTWFKSEGKIDLDPETAVRQVIALFGVQAPQAAPVVAPQAGTTSATPPVQTPQMHHKNVPIIPGVPSTGSSPVAQKPKSIKELREIGQRMARG